MIELKAIRKSYQLGNERLEILKGIDLHIKRGDYVSIMGPSGSGKSTLMNILGILDTPSEGDYLFKNTNISEKDENQLADFRNHQVGFVFQNFNLMPRLTAVENVALPLMYACVNKKERLKRAKEALQKVGLSERMTFKPNELSGGQKQRVAIARALVTEAEFILADEPTGALDSKTSVQIMALFSQLNQQGKTIVIITHEQEIADCTKRKIVLKDGMIVGGN